MTRRKPSVLHLQLGQEVIYLLLATFAITSLILALFLVIKVRQQSDRSRSQGEIVTDLEAKIAAARKEIDVLKGAIGETSGSRTAVNELGRSIQQQSQTIVQQEALLRNLRSENEALRRERDNALQGEATVNAEIARQKQLNDKPPIINLKEAEGYSFPLGDATLTASFRDRLSHEAVGILLDSARLHGATVVEVIGHTDELPVSGRTSNLDGQLIPFLRSTARGGQPLTLSAADNAGLGMARAAAVAQYLMTEPRLRGQLRVLALSGAQIIDTNDSLSAGGDPRDASMRRRIEIRSRRPNDQNAR